MKGARGYAGLFETGQYGKLYIVSGSHARGKTFHIQVLPEGERAISNGAGNLCVNENAVEVYGIVGGQPGWTEYYGWKHEGPWQDDFKAEVEKCRVSIAQQEGHHYEVRDREFVYNAERIKKLLEAY